MVCALLASGKAELRARQFSSQLLAGRKRGRAVVALIDDAAGQRSEGDLFASLLGASFKTNECNDELEVVLDAVLGRASV